ncbi:MAG: proton-conducting transporter membrane subunit, partial [Candidatus Falkowbacteria bacterium]|nr:proton-conducting transporter membrane subunit [Candidatus Falkowbacteria bacterium]
MLEFFSSSAIIFEIIFLFCVGAIGSLFYGKDDEFANWWGNIFAGLGSLLGIIFSTGVLLRGQELNFNFKSYFPLLSFSVHVDYLAAFFVLIISLIALPCSIYSVGYVKYFYQKYNIGVLGFFYNIFLASMILVAIVSNIIFFIIVWELMTMASYFLVIFENREKNNIKAGLLYFIMTHIGTAFIMLLFLFLYKTTGSLEFSAIKDGMINTPNQIKSIILILALIGFGTKSGIIPFHIWLPSAHPAAPSHVSALMSGVMIKMGIYMIIRISFDILSNVPLWFGLLVLIAGAISAILGVLYALNEHDLKRLLAYHSIENIGIILLGLGSSLVFLSMNMPALATIGLIAALYHTINHAVFKSLLFLGAGVVVSATHTRNIEKYGGLIKYMPQTALFFLVGSMAISALPPFNGFVSEWMIFQSL